MNHVVHRNATAGQTLAVMGRTATEAASTPAVREWAATLAAKAGPRDYVGQLRELYDGIIERWRYVQEPDEWVHGTAKSLLGTVAGVKYNGRHDPRSINLARVPTHNKGWGDCDDVATLTAAGVRALGMKPYFRVTRSPKGAHVSVIARTPRGQIVSLDPVGHPEHGFGWSLPSDNVSVFDMHARGVSGLSGEDKMDYGCTENCESCESCMPTAMGSWDDDVVSVSPDAHVGHMAMIPYGDIDGPRVLAVPERYADLMSRGIVVDGIPAIDEMGNEYRYSSDRDVWIDQRLNPGMGDISARERRRAKRRRIFKRIVKRIRGVVAKILGSKIAQNLVGLALQVYGVPRRLTVGVMAAGAEILKKGGIPALIRLIRKDPKAAMRLVAQAAKTGLKKIANPLGGIEDAPHAHVVQQNGEVFYGAPIEMIVGVPGVHELGAITVSSTPTPGRWYRIRRGDSLLSVAGKAYGVSAGSQRLEVARWVNEADANEPYFDRSLTDALFKSGKISFSPKFAQSPDSAIKGAPGSSYAVIWIPIAKGDEPPDEPILPGDTSIPKKTIPPKTTIPKKTIPKKTIPPKDKANEFERACLARGGHVVNAAGGGVGCAICQPGEMFNSQLQRCIRPMIPKKTIPKKTIPPKTTTPKKTIPPKDDLPDIPDTPNLPDIPDRPTDQPKTNWLPIAAAIALAMMAK